MIRRNTWLLLVLLAASIGSMYYINNQKALRILEDAPTPENTLLFDAVEGLPTSILIESADGSTTELVHNSAGAWALIQPADTAADQGLAEAAATEASGLRELGEINLGLDVLGLDQPAYVITIGFTGGNDHKLEVGSVTPTQSGYYVRLDGGRSVIVSKTSLDALVNLAAFPPYAETPTPSPAPPTGTLLPMIETTATSIP